MIKLFLLLLLAFAANAALDYYSVVPDTFMDKPVVFTEEPPELDVRDITFTKVYIPDVLKDTNADFVARSVDVDTYGLNTVSVYLFLVLTPDKKAWDGAKTTSIFSWTGDNPKGTGWTGGKCVSFAGQWGMMGGFGVLGNTYWANNYFYRSCFPKDVGLLVFKDGYSVMSKQGPTFSNDNGYTGSTELLWTNNKLESQCGRPFAYTGKKKGPNGACCRFGSDCQSSACSNNAVCTKCDSKFVGWGNKDGSYGDCCGTDADCSRGCHNNRCEGRCNGWADPGDGFYGTCCFTNADCGVGTCLADGYCSDISGCTRAKGRKDGLFDDCCSTTEDCVSPGVCRHPRYKCEAPESYCAGRKLGLKDGKKGDCCKTGADCLSGSCPTGTCTAPSLNCISGHEGYTNKSLTSSYCCNTDSSCIGVCKNGICGYNSHNGCTTGYEEYDDYGSEEGYCCVSQFGSCEGGCINGVCTDVGSGTCINCIVGHEGDGNGNLSPQYCCKDGVDCLYGCTNGQCIAGSMSSCPKPTKTTTSTKPTQTNKPNPKEIKIGDIIIAPCVTVACPPGGVVVGILGSAFSFAAAFVPIFHDDDDDKTTTTTTTTTATTSSKPTKSTTTALSTSSTTPRDTSTTVASTANSTTTTGSTYSITTGPTSGGTTSVNTISGTGTISVTTGNGTISLTSSTVVTVPSASVNSTFAISTITSGPLPTVVTTSSTIPSTTSVTVSSVSSTIFASSTVLTSSTVRSSTSDLPTTTSDKISTSTTVSTTNTAVPTGKTCKSGYYSKNKKNAPDGSCCSTSGDCVGVCVYVPGDSYMCKDGTPTTSTSVVTLSSTVVTTVSSIPKPTSTCITGYCGKGLGNGPTGACCADHWDCNQVCNGDGKCSDSDDGTWTKKLVCG